jgi:hypothetical protein
MGKLLFDAWPLWVFIKFDIILFPARMWMWKKTAIYLSAWAENNDMNIVIWTAPRASCGGERGQSETDSTLCAKVDRRSHMRKGPM